MNKTVGIVAASVAIALLSSCAASRYIISTNDGTMIQTAGEPKLNKDTGMYEYKDLNGNNGSIKQADVKQVLKQ